MEKTFYQSDRLRAAIEAAGTNQAALAVKIDITPQTIQRCTAERRPLSDRVLGRASEALDVSLGWLKDGTMADNASKTECAAIMLLALSVMDSRQISSIAAIADALVGDKITHIKGIPKP